MKKNLGEYMLWAVVVLFILSGSGLFAQVPSNPIGSNPPGLKWNQIHTDKVQVIFPEGLENEGHHVTRLAHYFWEHKDSTIGSKNGKITILLNNQRVSGNGLVTVGPFRSEFYPIPRQFRASHDYLNHLTLHEYRHVQQFNNSVQGITKTVKSVLGSWAWGGMLAMALPRWYLEGDAVLAETDYSLNGRGRFAPFLMEYHALIAENKTYNFEKAAAGSIKDFVPDWYNLGYHMLSRGRDEFGIDIWPLVAEDAVRFKGILFPFSRNLKKRTGWNAKKLYEETVKHLEESWNPPARPPDDYVTTQVNQQPKKTVTHYNNPHFTGDQEWIAVKSSYEDLSSFVRINRSGNEEKIMEPGILLEPDLGSVSIEKDKIVWTAYSRDRRWQNRNYSDIFLYDLSERHKKKLTKKGRYFSPEISKDGKRIAAVRIDENLDHSLVIFRTSDGALVNEITLTAFEAYQFPTWDDQGRVVLVASKDQTNQLVRVDPLIHPIEALMSPTTAQISHPVHHGDQIFFSWAPSRINNIYVLNENTGEVIQVTYSTVGAFQPDISDDGKSLVYAEFSTDGYDLYQIELSGIFKTSATQITPSISTLSRLDSAGLQPPVISVHDTFPTRKFNKWSGIISPHSLLVEFQHPVTSLRLLSDNTFGTMSGEIGAFYNYNEHEWSYQANLTYAELFPVIRTGFVHANRSGAFLNYGPLTDSTYVRQVSAREWSENRIRIGLGIPLEMISGNVLHALQVFANYRYIDVNTGTDFDPSISGHTDTIFYEANRSQVSSVFAQPIFSTSFHSLDMGLSFQTVKRRARLNVRPKLGMGFGMRYRATLGSQGLGGNVLLGSANLFLPGMAKNHSLRVSVSYQNERRLDNYRFSDVFGYPRGYNLSLRRDEFLTWRMDYMLPLFYPDRAIGPLAFIKRVKANLFYDHGVFKVTEEAFSPSSEKMRSAGLEINFDFRAFRLAEVDLGFRYSYLLDAGFAIGNKRHILDFFVVSITQ